MDDNNCLLHHGNSHIDSMTSRHTSRRAVLAGLTAIGAGALFPWTQALAQKASGNPRRIDVHHHFTPPEYQAFTAAHPGAGGFGGGRGRGGNANAGRGGGALGSARAGWVLAEDLED